MPEIPEFILERVHTGAVLITADEVATWPSGQLDDLVAAGVLVPEQPARSISCNECGDDHIELVEYVQSPPGTVLRAYIPCPALGRVCVPLERLHQWRIDATNTAVVAALASADDETGASTAREWPDPQEHTTGKYWTRQDGVICLSTKTDGNHDGTVEFAPTTSGELTFQMRFMQVMCFKFPNAITLAEIIEQVYPQDYATARRDPAMLRRIVAKLRALVSDIRKRKIAKAGLNPDILPGLSVDAPMDAGIGLRLANLRRFDDRDLDEADEAPP
ncbi:MAG: hypothetical protein AB7L90_22875 [Hyphomicrobiaceae bacterium]